MEDIEALKDQIKALEQEVKMLRESIDRGIQKECQWYCALSECPKAIISETEPF